MYSLQFVHLCAVSSITKKVVDEFLQNSFERIMHWIANSGLNYGVIWIHEFFHFNGIFVNFAQLNFASGLLYVHTVV